MKEKIIHEGSGAIIQFLHANAYTPGCYNQVAEVLKNFEIRLPYQRPLWANSDPSDLKDWNLFVDDLIVHMDSIGRKNVIGIGHSMGGVTTLLASIKRPDLFSQIILIDPVILPGLGTSVMSLIPFSIKLKYFPIVKIASRRRNQWKTKEDARQHFMSKKIFQRFDQSAFKDFLDFGLREHEDGITLAYPREWESRVYGTAPNLWGRLSKVSCHTTLIRAEYSDVITDERWKAIRNKMINTNFVQADNVGHLLPFEQPALCAALIQEHIISERKE